MEGGRVKLTEVNPHLVCVLCHGYFVDATTIAECLHSFCKSCIFRYLERKSYCPICEVQVHKTKLHLSLKPDKTLQDIVYKLVPGLFHNEMQRRRDFYKEHPYRDDHLDPECRGVGLDRLIYSPEDMISLSLEFYDKEREREEWSNTGSPKPTTQENPNGSKRYLRCPAGFKMAHLKKFLREKYNVSPICNIEILYRRESLPDSYSLMDVAYIYTWKRNGPMRFYYRLPEVVDKKFPIPIKIPMETSNTSEIQELKDGAATSTEKEAVPAAENVEKAKENSLNASNVVAKQDEPKTDNVVSNGLVPARALSKQDEISVSALLSLGRTEHEFVKPSPPGEPRKARNSSSRPSVNKIATELAENKGLLRQNAEKAQSVENSQANVKNAEEPVVVKTPPWATPPRPPIAFNPLQTSTPQSGSVSLPPPPYASASHSLFATPVSRSSQPPRRYQMPHNRNHNFQHPPKSLTPRPPLLNSLHVPRSQPPQITNLPQYPRPTPPNAHSSTSVPHSSAQHLKSQLPLHANIYQYQRPIIPKMSEANPSQTPPPLSRPQTPALPKSAQNPLRHPSHPQACLPPSLQVPKSQNLTSGNTFLSSSSPRAQTPHKPSPNQTVPPPDAHTPPAAAHQLQSTPQPAKGQLTPQPGKVKSSSVPPVGTQVTPPQNSPQVVKPQASPPSSPKVDPKPQLPPSSEAASQNANTVPNGKASVQPPPHVEERIPVQNSSLAMVEPHKETRPLSRNGLATTPPKSGASPSRATAPEPKTTSSDSVHSPNFQSASCKTYSFPSGFPIMKSQLSLSKNDSRIFQIHGPGGIAHQDKINIVTSTKDERKPEIVLNTSNGSLTITAQSENDKEDEINSQCKNGLERVAQKNITGARLNGYSLTITPETTPKMPSPRDNGITIPQSNINNRLPTFQKNLPNKDRKGNNHINGKVNGPTLDQRIQQLYNSQGGFKTPGGVPILKVPTTQAQQTKQESRLASWLNNRFPPVSSPKPLTVAEKVQKSAKYMNNRPQSESPVPQKQSEPTKEKLTNEASPVPSPTAPNNPKVEENLKQEENSKPADDKADVAAQKTSSVDKQVTMLKRKLDELRKNHVSPICEITQENPSPDDAKKRRDVTPDVSIELLRASDMKKEFTIQSKEQMCGSSVKVQNNNKKRPIPGLKSIQDISLTSKKKTETNDGAKKLKLTTVRKEVPSGGKTGRTEGQIAALDLSRAPQQRNIMEDFIRPEQQAVALQWILANRLHPQFMPSAK